MHHKQQPGRWAGCAPDESHAAGRPEQQAERLCAERVADLGGAEKNPEADPAFFCDLSTPKNDGSFNVYEDIKAKLLAAGVRKTGSSSSTTPTPRRKRRRSFQGALRGCTHPAGQHPEDGGGRRHPGSRLVAVHHLDVGWKPSDMTQRNGRIIRQGNQNKQVYVYNYVAEGTFDAYLWQTLENKQRFISRIMTSKSPVRSCEDVDEQALSYAEDQGAVCRQSAHQKKRWTWTCRWQNSGS